MTKPVMLMLGEPTERMRAPLDEAFELLTAIYDVDDVLDAHGDRVEYLLAMYHGDVTAEVMDRMPKLKVISNFGVGYDSIDTGAAVERGIVVTHTPEVLDDEVANTTVLMLLASARNLLQDAKYLLDGRWESEGDAPLSRSIRGTTVGFLGMGRIGQTIAEKLAVFGVEMVYHSRSPKDVSYKYYGDLTDMAAACDYMIVIAPGGASTYHIVNRQVMEALGPEGTLINVGRGSVVDEAALVEVLKEGKLGAAALDVFEDEPHVPEALLPMENVLLLPHVGSATVETRAAMGDLAVKNLVTFKQTGKAVTPVPECKGM
ncbi:2-hydroxyacid dehydrogenase [Pseudoruegeria sp. HB172150]|uniref:2-hydroxyacid dehydrogenase n=1 Tax=Pseudoruegeria sp. HB172150 TaxID=2721164 RepID=UPI0015565445|nr:2-hydroxyacid dehydrogenase [Pseudoruegeria sp. HB172150]